MRTDEFYGKPLATVVRTILERRAAASLGAASVDVIYAAMKAGGYMFNAKSDNTAKTALATSLAKNTVTFHKLPHGDFGLLEWYPNIPVKTRGNGRQDESDEEAEEEETETPDEPEEDDGLKEPYRNEFAEPEMPKQADGEKDKKPRRAGRHREGSGVLGANSVPPQG